MQQKSEHEIQPLLVASILGADWLQFGAAVEIAENAHADLIQIDIVDGHFAPTITFGEELVKRVRQKTALPLEVHLMVSRPQDWISLVANIGVEFILFHAEAAQRLHGTVEMCRRAGVGAGVVLNPATPPETLQYVLPYVDIVTLMAISPGFAGQSFIPETLAKIEKLRHLIDQDDRSLALIEVDGGIKRDNVAEVVNAGADMVVASSAIYQAANPEAAGAELKQAMTWPANAADRQENVGAFLKRIEQLNNR